MIQEAVAASHRNKQAQRLEGLKRSKPSPAVLSSMPGIWLCQCSSLRLFWPACRNISWAGMSSGAAALPSAARAASSSGSRSRAKSHTWMVNGIMDDQRVTSCQNKCLFDLLLDACVFIEMFTGRVSTYAHFDVQEETVS